MKKIIKFLLFIFSFYAGRSQSNSATENFKKLLWLEGKWNRINEKPGRTNVETWILDFSLELHGYGVTMKGADTVFIEKFKLTIQDNNIYYVADVPQNKQPVPFKLTKITENEFICENRMHDFPKQIAYVRSGNKLKATISGNGKSIDYLFEKDEK